MFVYAPLASIVLILIAYLLYYKNHRANIYLAQYFIVVSFGLFVQANLAASTDKNMLAFCYLNFASIYLLPGPLLYFYVRGRVWNQLFSIRKDFLHFIPFIFFLVITMPWIFTSYETKLAVMDRFLADRNQLLTYDAPLRVLSIGVMYVLRPAIGLLYVLCTLIVCIRYYNQGISDEMINTRMPLKMYTLLIFQLIMFTLYLFNSAVMVYNSDIYGVMQRGVGKFIFVTQVIYFLVQLCFGTMAAFVLNRPDSKG
jgi:hypothetical protein